MTTFKTLARRKDGKEVVLFGEDVPGRKQRAFYKEFRKFGHPEYVELHKVVVVRRVQPFKNTSPRRLPTKPQSKPSLASRFFGGIAAAVGK